MTNLREWIGRTETLEDVASPVPLEGLAALLDHETPPWTKGELPPLAHWLYFLPHARQSEIDVDGHPRRGGFMPPVDLPRRMFAGSALTIHAPVPVGAKLRRRSTILDVSEKSGASGRLVFVKVRHEIGANEELSLTDDHDIVYREAATSVAPPPPKLQDAPRTSEHTRRIVPDPTLLFRFSALTFNAHRIHYDRDYCREVEFYPGLVVQGPFIAMLLLDHLLRLHPALPIREFRFRAKNPLYDTAPFEACLASRQGGFDLWARDLDGRECVTAVSSI
jgi:3-methylfumaryl-CoA hydratase